MSTVGDTPFKYAKFLGFESVPAAIIFAVIYLPLFVWFVFKSIANRTEVHYMLTVFCLIRTVAFTIRAVLAGSDSAGENLGLLIADEVLSAIGFFGLLYSAYSLVLELARLADHPPHINPVIKITQNRQIFRVITTVAVALGIVSITMTEKSGSGSSTSSSNALKISSTVIFLGVTILQVFQTVYFARLKASDPEQYRSSNNSFGRRHAILLLIPISILLLVRAAFATAALVNSKILQNEHFWYPLTAAPELLAIFIFSIPGLVPNKKELRTAEHHSLG